MDYQEFDKRRTAKLRKFGLLEPDHEDPLTEFGQGWLLGFNKALGRETVLATNQHWNATPDGSVAHSIGYGLGVASPVLIPLIAVAIWYAIWKFKKKRRLRRIVRAEKERKRDAARVQALQELESGQLNPLAMAKAVEQSAGDAGKAKSLYLKIRVEQIMLE